MANRTRNTGDKDDTAGRPAIEDDLFDPGLVPRGEAGSAERPRIAIATNAPGLVCNSPAGSQTVTLPDGAAMTLAAGTIRADDPIAVIEDLFDAAAIGICRGSLIATPDGPRPVESLVAGDVIDTHIGGPRPITWIGHSRVTASGALAPVTITANLFGTHEALTVMPQQRILISDWRADLLFGDSENLIPARFLVNETSVTRRDAGEIDCFMLLLPRHDAITANGLLTESFQPGEQTLMALDDFERRTILRLFPRLRSDPANGYGRAARPTLRQWEVKYLMR
ncbi:Hint domain-containing protein [Rhodobacteraceae bacterium NNCM2]|nr:Hint domain-containing protein [Coraliihabitans acroporae]